MVIDMRAKSLFIIIVLAVIMTGCRKDERSKQNELKEQEKDTITFMVKVMGDKNTPLDELIKEYNQTSDIKVKIKKVAYDEYQYVLNMKMLSADRPDLFMLDNDWLTTYIEKDWLLPINSDDGEKLNEQYDYVIPLGRSTYKLVYNKDIFEEVGLDPDKPPKTLEELYEYSVKISKMKIGDSYGFALYLKEKESGFINLLEDVYKINGLYYYNKEEHQYDFTIYKDWFEEMIKIRRESGTLEYALELKKESVINQFSEGNIGMMIMSNEDYYWLPSHDMNLGVSKVPISYQEDVSVDNISIPGMLVGISSTSRHIEAIRDLCMKLTSEEWSAYMLKEGYIIPFRHFEAGEADSFSDLKIPTEFLPHNKVFIYDNNTLYNENERIRFDIYNEILKEERAVEDGLNVITKLLNEMQVE